MTTTIEVPRGSNIGKAIQQIVPKEKRCNIKFLNVYRDVKKKCNVAKIIII